MATLTVFNRAEEIVADGLSFTDFKQRFGRGSALIITLDCGEDVFSRSVPFLLIVGALGFFL